MQALIHAIATVQVRIQTNGPLYANSELQTRYGLIDLILRALEWDITNPDEVQVEYPVIEKRKSRLCLAMSRQAACGDRGEVAGRKVLQGWKIRDLGIAAKSAQLVLVCTDGNHWKFYEAQNREATTTSGNFVAKCLRSCAGAAFSLEAHSLHPSKPSKRYTSNMHSR
jgi:hypothetical protein